MVQTVSISGETDVKLTLKLNDWLKQLPEDKIIDIQFIWRKGKGYIGDPYLAFVTYRK